MDIYVLLSYIVSRIARSSTDVSMAMAAAGLGKHRGRKRLEFPICHSDKDSGARIPP